MMDAIFRLWRHSSGTGCRNPDEAQFTELEAAIYCTLVARDIAMVELCCTLAYKPG
jgi:hypothetical protein